MERAILSLCELELTASVSFQSSHLHVIFCVMNVDFLTPRGPGITAIICREATGLSLIQRSPNECGVCVCVC